MNLPDDIATEIAGKRKPDSSEDTTPKDEPKKDEQPAKDEQPKKDEPKDGEPEPKKGAAAKPKNGQSIAQVAAATEEDGDEDEDEDEDDPDGDDKSTPKKRGSIFKEFLGIKKELKETKRERKEMAQQYSEMSTAVEELVDLVKSLKSSPGAQKDEIEEFAEEWGLDKEGTQKLVGLLEKRLTTKFSPKRKDETEDEPKAKKEVKKDEPKKSALTLRQVELAIESEYDDFVDTYPDVKGKLNLKAIKSYILSDEENQTKSFADIVNDMYPGALAKKASVDGASDGIDRSDEDTEGIDWNDEKTQKRAQKDPKLNKAYHEDLMSRVKGIYN